MVVLYSFKNFLRLYSSRPGLKLGITSALRSDPIKYFILSKITPFYSYIPPPVKIKKAKVITNIIAVLELRRECDSIFLNITDSNNLSLYKKNNMILTNNR